MVKKWFSIEGNIGSGKSTFCRLFAEKYNNIDICLEPVNAWINLKDDKTNKDFLHDVCFLVYRFYKLRMIFTS